MHKTNEKLTFIAIGLNTFLFVIKLIVGIISNSLALISDALNSLSDIVSSTAIYFAIQMSNDKADDCHPFGHFRIQPLAGFVVAIFTAILGFEILRTAIKGFFSPKLPIVTIITIIVPIITMVVKFGMFLYYKYLGKKDNSPGFKAISVDALNDVFISIIVLSAVIGAKFNVHYIDSFVAVLISLFIFYAAYNLGMENINYLIGKSPPERDILRIRRIVRKIKGVRGINDIRAHYVGNFVHIEIHIEVDRKISTEKSHMIGKDVQYAVEELDYIDKAFVHIDPV